MWHTGTNERGTSKGHATWPIRRAAVSAQPDSPPGRLQRYMGRPDGPSGRADATVGRVGWARVVRPLREADLGIHNVILLSSRLIRVLDVYTVLSPTTMTATINIFRQRSVNTSSSLHV